MCTFILPDEMDILSHINEVKHSLNEDISKLLKVVKHLENLSLEVQQNGSDSKKVIGLLNEVRRKGKDANVANNCFVRAVDDVVNYFMPKISWHSNQQEMLEMYYTQGNSPWEFWLTYNSSGDMDSLLKTIEQRQKDGKLKNVDSPSIGQFVCCYDSRTFFRGLVLKITHNNTRVRVLNVDKFNEKIIKSDCIYVLPQDVCEPHANSMQCCLMKDNSDERRWNRELEGLFRNVLSESRLTIRIIDEIEALPPKFIVELYAFNESLEVETNVSHWICNRLLPQLKQLDEEIRNEDIISYLSEELLDPFVCIPGMSQGSGSEDDLDSCDTQTASHNLNKLSAVKFNPIPKNDMTKKEFLSQMNIKLANLSPVSLDSRASQMSISSSVDLIKPKDPVSSTNIEPHKNRNRLAYLMNSHTEPKMLPPFAKALDRGRILEERGFSLVDTLSASEFVPQQNYNKVDGAPNGTVLDEELFIKPNTLDIGNYEGTFSPADYIPKDEIKICAFFAKNNYCWKPSCDKVHEKISVDRWTNETTEIYKEASNNINLPRKGAKVHARATNIISPTMFYVNLPDDYSETEEGEKNETYQTMMTDLNNAENIKQLKLLVTNPCIGEFVVIFSSRRKKWFRAQVYDIYENSLIQVFLVDCGQYEEVHLDNCRVIEPQFIHLPYQAVYCTLANVFCETYPGSVQGGNSFLNDLILDKEIVMEVVVSDPVDIRLEVIVNVDGINVNETMVDSGFCNWYMK